MMPHFDLYQPDTLDGALELAARLGERRLAGRPAARTAATG